jgi:acyl carrier protein
MAGPGETPNGSPSGSSGGAISRAAFSGQSDRFQRIANVFAEVRAICSAMDASRSSVPGAGEEFTDGESPTTLGGKFLRIWRKAIGNSRMGMDDNFFEAGGTSLKAVQVIAALRRELQLQVSIVNLFECPTVRLLCEKFEPGKAIDRSANQAMERGARRKQLLRKRTD